MKCLLCSSQFEERDKLIEHYISYHNINKNNFFFKCLLQNIENKPHLKKCIRCDEFITIKKYKVEHDFLKHYDDGNEIPFEEKPLQIVRNKALIIYKIEYSKHNEKYDFYNAEKCVDDFLLNVKHKYKASSKKWFKCSFTIENVQNALSPHLQFLTNNRYWTTETYDAIYFNDFIFFSLKTDILKRVIINRLSGSSWYFRRFLNLAVKVLDTEGLDISK